MWGAECDEGVPDDRLVAHVAAKIIESQGCPLPPVEIREQGVCSFSSVRVVAAVDGSRVDAGNQAGDGRLPDRIDP